MRDRLIKNYKAAAATVRDATQLAKDLTDATRNFLAEQLYEDQRFDCIDRSSYNETLYVDPRGTAKRATDIPKRLTFRKHIIDGVNHFKHRGEEIDAIFEAAKIIRQREAANKQSRRQRNAQSRRDRVTRMAQNFAARHSRT